MYEHSKPQNPRINIMETLSNMQPKRATHWTPMPYHVHIRDAACKSHVSITLTNDN